MDGVVLDIYEEFVMSEACSRFYAFYAQDSDAQDMDIYCDYIEHAKFCEKVAETCKDFLNTKNVDIFFSRLRIFGLYSLISIIIKNVYNKNYRN